MRERIRAAWRAPSAPGADGPKPRDGVLAGAVVAAAIGEGALRADLTWPFAAIGLAILVAIGLPWRRRYPLVINVAIALVASGYELVALAAGAGQNVLGTMFVAILFPYAMFRWGSGRARIVGAAIQAVGLGVSLVVGGEGIPGAVAGLAFVGGACLAGALRRERVAARSRERERIRVREREVLARDLHDTVAHHVSAVVLHAQAARVTLEVDRLQAERSLTMIESEAQAALVDMRALVRVLRADDVAAGGGDPADARENGADATRAPYRPTAGLDDLRGLAAEGPPVVRVRVEPRGLTDAVAQTAFRIAAESVTNARRHARGVTTIEVVVTEQRGAVAVDIHDDGSGGTSRADGYGIRGMTERAALLGGTLTAGPDPRGGWRVAATLPNVEES